MNVSLTSETTEAIFSKLQEANEQFNQSYPGDSGARQPVHTVYGGAHLFKADSAKKLGQAASNAMAEYAPDWIAFAHALNLPGASSLPDTPLQISTLNSLVDRYDGLRREQHSAWIAHTVYKRVIEKLNKEAVEDFRIDFEDGYGIRSDEEEDGHAAQAAAEVAKGMAEGLLPPFIGIRVKPLSEELKHRSARTLDIFVGKLVEQSKGKLPDNFVITLPKSNIPGQVHAFVELLNLLETKTGLHAGSLKIELMAESTQALFNNDGLFNMPLLLKAAGDRCVGLHFGAFDFTSSCDITAAHQSLNHPLCDFARHMMKMATAGTGIWLCDGVTNVLPIAPHRAGKGDTELELTEAQKKSNQEVVHHAWKLHYDHVMHALEQGFYQGWDLHPAQLAARYAAVYCFFLEGFDTTSARLKSLMQQAAQSSLTGNTFDDAANGQGLLNYFLRALNCGAITMKDAEDAGLTETEISTRSFLKIVSSRMK